MTESRTFRSPKPWSWLTAFTKETSTRTITALRVYAVSATSPIQTTRSSRSALDSPFIKMLVNKCPDHDVYSEDVVEVQRSTRGLRSQPNIETIRTSLCKACENAYSKVRTDSEATFMPRLRWSMDTESCPMILLSCMASLNSRRRASRSSSPSNLCSRSDLKVTSVAAAPSVSPTIESQ